MGIRRGAHVPTFASQGPWSVQPKKALTASILHELGAQIKPHQIPKRPYLQEKRLPQAFFHNPHRISVVHLWCRRQSISLRERGSFWGLAQLHTGEGEEPKVSKTAEAAGHHHNRRSEKADCFTLLKWITGLKLSIQTSGQSSFSLKNRGCTCTLASSPGV